MKKSRNLQRQRRHIRVRKKIVGTPDRPRLSVFRSQQNLFVQLIDDKSGHTLVSASTIEKDQRKELSSQRGLDAARKIGEEIAQKAKKAGITKVVFDRSGYQYHGRVKAVAESAREGGLEF